MKTGLQIAIDRNRRRVKYRLLINRMHLNHFEHEDRGRLDQAQRIIKRMRLITNEKH